MPRKPKPRKDPAPELKPLECPKCGCGHFDVASGPQLRDDGRRHRRRYCRHCGWMIRTIEGRV